MSAVAQQKCQSCDHIGAYHRLPIGGCRLGGCPCDQFRAVNARPESDEEARTLVVRIPPGHYASVTVYPITDAEPAEVETDGS